jgi:hypothetical protein
MNNSIFKAALAAAALVLAAAVPASAQSWSSGNGYDRAYHNDYGRAYGDRFNNYDNSYANDYGRSYGDRFNYDRSYDDGYFHRHHRHHDRGWRQHERDWD